MRKFIQAISYYSRRLDPEFIIIPQNGLELFTTNGDPVGSLVIDYLSAIDGVGQEDLFYGSPEDDKPTPTADTTFWLGFLDRIRASGKGVLITDYCSNHSKINDSYTKNASHQFISFAADHRELDHIPEYPPKPYQVNSRNVENLLNARNFLYLINPSTFTSKKDMIDSISTSDYDLLIIDPFFSRKDILSDSEITLLKKRSNGGKRLVVAYISIGEAENYRYYWKKEWEIYPPDWLAEENTDWKGNFKVRYWETDWQIIIFGIPGAYLDRIIEAGFDGVYLDGIDSFEYFENQE